MIFNGNFMIQVSQSKQIHGSFQENLMALDEGMKFHFARFITHEMIFTTFSNDFHGILSIPCFIVKTNCHMHLNLYSVCILSESPC